MTSCHVQLQYKGIDSEKINLFISTNDTLSSGEVKIKCILVNNKDVDIAILRLLDIKSYPERGPYAWFAKIVEEKNDKYKFIPLTDFFSFYPDQDSYIILKPNEFKELEFIIDFRHLSDKEYPLESIEEYMQYNPLNTDYGEYSVTISYYDQYRIHRNALNDKVVSNSIKIIYQSE